jgi:hypothetical protein
MTFQRTPRPLTVLASALAATGTVLAAAGCSRIPPLGADSAPASLPPPRHLGSPIIIQALRSQSPTATGRCPAGSVDLFGLEPGVPRLAVRPVHMRTRRTAAATARPATPGAQPAGVACYIPAGTAVRITTAAVSAVTTDPNQPGPAIYGFVVAFPAADVAALTTVIRQAYEAGDSVGMSVAGKLWQAPPLRYRFMALRAEQINLLSRNQAFRLHRLLV